MSAWTAETPQAPAPERQPAAEALGLRVWFGAWCGALERYNAAYRAAPGGLEVAPVEEVLATFKPVGAQLVDALNRLDAGHRLAPEAFRRLVLEGEALEAKAAAACEALPEAGARTPREDDAFAVCLLAQGLPFQLRDYAQHAGGILQ